jgi:hypothetical protein
VVNAIHAPIGDALLFLRKRPPSVRTRRYILPYWRPYHVVTYDEVPKPIWWSVSLSCAVYDLDVHARETNQGAACLRANREIGIQGHDAAILNIGKIRLEETDRRLKSSDIALECGDLGRLGTHRGLEGADLALKAGHTGGEGIDLRLEVLGRRGLLTGVRNGGKGEEGDDDERDED